MSVRVPPSAALLAGGLTALVLSALASPGALAGQSGPLPVAGSWGLGFGIPDGGGTVVVLRRVASPSTSLGLGFGTSLARSERIRVGEEERELTRWSASLHPDIRFYREAGTAVAPFLELNGLLAFSDDSQPGSAWAAGLGAGVGAEWFPVEQVSVAGSAGLSAEYRRQERTGVVDRSWSVGTLQSELTLTLYF